MNRLQIILVCFLGILGISFFVVVFMRFNESIHMGKIIHRKKLKKIVEILQNETTTTEQWNKIWPIFYSNGEINYSKIDAGLTYIINHNKYRSVKERAINLLRERIAITIFGDNEMTDAIETLNRAINQCGNQEIKDASVRVINNLHRFCRENSDKNKYDLLIQWIFNAIEIVGLVLAIITL